MTAETKKNSDSGVQRRRSSKSKSKHSTGKSKNGQKTSSSIQKTSPSIQKTSPSIQKTKSTSKETKPRPRGNRSKMSEKSRESAQKSVKASPKAGLSPPKGGLSPPKSRSSMKPNEASNRDIDSTQWEFSHYKDEAKGIVSEDPNTYVTDKVGEATPFLAEEKQKMLVRGEHLLKKPTWMLIFIAIEIAVALLVLIVWSCFTGDNEFIPVVVCFANVIILLIVVLIVFVVQFTRMNVVEEELNEDVRFRIPYGWKYFLCMLHLLRFFLTCSNITIACLDNNFDAGVVFVIAGMPIMLILSSGHILFAVKHHT